MTHKSNRVMKAKVEELVNGLTYDFHGYTLANFLQWLECHTGFQVWIWEAPLGLCNGLWLNNEDEQEDYIVVNSGLDAFRREHTIWHELGHILLGHTTRQATYEDVQQLLAQLHDRATPRCLSLEYVHATVRSTMRKRKRSGLPINFVNV